MKTFEDSWARRSLEKLSSLIKDGSHGTHKDVLDGVPLLSAKDVHDGDLKIPDNCRRISDADYLSIHKNYRIMPDDILLTIVGTIGRCYLIKGIEPDFSIQRSVAVIRPKGIQPEYLYQFFRSEPFQTNLKNLTNASAQGGMYLNSLAKCFVNFPTAKTEQAKIARLLSTVDRAIKETEALIVKQQRIKTGLMQDLLTHGIDEYGSLRSRQTHKFKNSPLGKIPVEWEIGELETITEFVTSGSRGWAQYYGAEGAMFLRIGNLTRDHINLLLEDMAFVNPPRTAEGKRTSVLTGDLLISITADLGIIGVIPEDFGEAYVNQHIALVRLSGTEVNSRFIGWFLSSHRGRSQFEKLNESGAKAGLNLPTIKKLLVPITRPDEQARIAEILDISTSRVSDHYSSLRKLRSLKVGLMQDLLTGKKLVTSLSEKEVSTT